MRQVDRLIKKEAVNLGALVVETKLLRKIVSDMSENAGFLMPTANWITLRPDEDVDADCTSYVSAARSDESVAMDFAATDNLMDAWLGSVHRQPLGSYYVQRYGRLLRHLDPLDLWSFNVDDAAVARTLTNSDLGTLMDLNLLYAFGPRNRPDPIVFLEVGGGYGRLAEAAFNVFGGSIRYVLVDAVPGSLCYSVEYLRNACPSIRVGSYYEGDALDLERFDCYVAPSWRFEEVSDIAYDVCVNIESFQEMAQRHVNYYLELFNRVSREGSLIYLSNARDYVFRGAWNYPVNWQKVLCTNTPRSWTDDHPTEVFVKSCGDFSLANASVEAFYRESGRPRTFRRSLRTSFELFLQSANSDFRRRLDAARRWRLRARRRD